MTVEFYVIRNGKRQFLTSEGKWTTNLMKARTFDKEIDVEFYLKRGRNLWALESELVEKEGTLGYNSRLTKINSNVNQQ